MKRSEVRYSPEEERVDVGFDTEGLDPDEIVVEAVRLTFLSFGWVLTRDDADLVKRICAPHMLQSLRVRV